VRHVPDSLMVFAAGFGTRMGALTAERPKPLIPVAGRCLLDHALDQADGLGLRRIVVNLHYRGEQIAQHLQARPEIALSWERAQILETGGGLRHALSLLGEGPVFTLNSDAVWAGANPLRLLANHWDADRMDALLLLAEPEAALGYGGSGDFTLEANGRITRATAGGLAYLGAQIVNPAGLAGIAQTAFSLNLLWDRMIAEGRAFGLRYPGGWCDVGRPDGVAMAETMLRAQDV
jgi:N-acetyl-alpha-D-muramate 1-phosphate uridylyltransferase